MPNSPPNFADADGTFRRQESKFRSVIPSAQFPAEAGRYVLYINYGCPWAHRTNIVRTLKGLEPVIQLVEVDAMDPAPGKGWYFSGRTGPAQDPVTGAKYLRELYERSTAAAAASAGAAGAGAGAERYEGRVTVPTLWDTQSGTIVSNESSDIIRMFYDGFDEFVPPERREEGKGAAALFPVHLREEIEEMNAWVYDAVNNGVYKCGFATAQAAYDDAVGPLFAALDRLEAHLAEPQHRPYLFGEYISEADIRLFPTIARFDVAYYTLFKCNVKSIRHDYPRLHEWLRRLYWDESERTNGAFRNTTRFEQIKRGYAGASKNAVVPAGPVPHILPL